MNYIQHQSQIAKHIPGKVYSYIRTFCTKSQRLKDIQQKPNLKLDYDYLCDPKNAHYIDRLIKCRKNFGNIWKVLEIDKELKSSTSASQQYESLRMELEREALKIPNKASPHLWDFGEDPKILEYVNPKPEFNFRPREFSELGQMLDILRTENLGNLTGSRSYYFKGPLADLEQALIR